MQIENFAPRECDDPSGLLVLRFGTVLDNDALRALCDALVDANIVDPMPRDHDDKITYPPTPAEVIGLSWRPPTPESIDAQRGTLESIGDRFGVEAAWCFQARYGLDARIRAGWFPQSLPRAASAAHSKLVEAASEEASAAALAELEAVLDEMAPADSRAAAPDPSSLGRWPDGDEPFPVDGYPEIIKELQWDDFGVALKLGGPRLAGEEQVVRAFHELWFKSFRSFRHVGVEYDPVRRAAVLWTDRWWFPRAEDAVVLHTLWIATRLNQVLRVVHARFQVAEMGWKYRGLTGDTSEPSILAGNPLSRIFRDEGEPAAMRWIEDQTAWSDREVAAMLVEVVEQHEPDDPEDSVVAIRLADRAITLDPDQGQARADILFTLVRTGRVDEALGRVRQWGRPGLTAHLVDLVVEHAPEHVPAAVDEALDRLRQWRRPELALRLATVAAEHVPDRVPIALAAVPTAILGDWASDGHHVDTMRDAIRLIVEHTPERMADVLAVLVETTGGLSALAVGAWGLSERGRFTEALTIYDTILASRVVQPELWIYHCALFLVAADNNNLPVQPERARNYLATCLPHGPEDPKIFYNAACLWIELDELDHTLECLRLARRHGYDKPVRMRDDRVFRPIADDPRFREIFADLEGIDADDCSLKVSPGEDPPF